MTPQQARDLVPVLTAYAEGKVVQYQRGEESRWYDFEGDNSAINEPYLFGNEHIRWRIKPQPREWWLCPVCGSISVCGLVQHSPATQHTTYGVVHVREVLP